MKSKRYIYAAIIVFLVIISFSFLSKNSVSLLNYADLDPSPHNCRFFAVISNNVPEEVIINALIGDDHAQSGLGCGLIQNYSLKTLAFINSDGWSVGYYSENDLVPNIQRGRDSAFFDAGFNKAAIKAAAKRPPIAFSHVRRCLSGLCKIPNPHPFVRFKNGKHFIMGHNGFIEKDLLLKLIRPEYIAENPPTIGSNQEEWIDSELYFIFMMQSFEDFNWQIEDALRYVIRCIHLYKQNYNGLNFFLSDGIKLWAYCEDYSLYYIYNNEGAIYSAVASMYPTLNQGNWIQVQNGQFLIMDQDAPPVVEQID